MGKKKKNRGETGTKMKYGQRVREGRKQSNVYQRSRKSSCYFPLHFQAAIIRGVSDLSSEKKKGLDAPFGM